MDEQDYVLMLETVRRACGQCEVSYLLTAERVLQGELGLDAQMERCREDCDRTLRDLTNLRSQAGDAPPGPMTTATATRTRSPVPSDWLWGAELVNSPSPDRALSTPHTDDALTGSDEPL